MKYMRIIKNRIWINQRIKNVFLVTLACFLISTIIAVYASKALTSYVESSLTEIAKQGSEILSRELKGKLNMLETVAKIESIQDPSVPVNEKVDMLNNYFISDEFLRISIANNRGYAMTTDAYDLYIGDREYYQKAIWGVKNISEPIISRVDGTIVVVFAVPVYYQNEVKYVLYATYSLETLSLITDEIMLGNNSITMIIDNDGRIIAHNNRAYVEDNKNFFDLLKPKVRNEFINHLIDLRQPGAAQYKEEGHKRYMGYAPIEDSKWGLVVTSPRKVVFGTIGQFLYFVIASLILVALIIVSLNYYMRYLKAKLYKQEVLSKNAIDTANIIAIEFDLEGRIIEFNHFAEGKTGYLRDEVVGKKYIQDLIDVEDNNKLHNLLKHYKDLGVSKFELTLLNSKGENIYVIWSINSIERPQETIELIGIDISEMILAQRQLQHQHEELTAVYEELAASEEELKSQFEQLVYHQEQLRHSEERYDLVVKAANIGIWDWDILSGKHYYSFKWYEIFGAFEGKEIRHWYSLIHVNDLPKVKNLIDGHLREKVDHFDCECRIKAGQKGEGEYRWVHIIGKVIWDYEKPYRLVAAFMDITEKKEYEQQILQYAYYDALTGLPNRNSLIKHFKILVRKQRKAALIFLDVDNLKLVNDTYGHSVGDQLIKEVGRRINAIKGHEYMVARISGDEFVVLLIDPMSKEGVAEYCHSLTQELDTPCSIRDTHLHISVSMGIAMFPEDGNNYETLLMHADLALYKAKESGRNRFVFYTKQMIDEALEKMTIQNYLRHALINEEFVVYYQPQYSIENENKIAGFEALIRWNSKDLGFVPPNKFISIAEENQTIIPIGEWVLRTACKFIKKLNDFSGEEYIVSVNISILQILQDDFVSVIADILREVHLAPSLLEIEITETMLIQSFDLIVEKLKILREMGVHIALDDFGKGYSSLSYLKQLPITTLKIDKSFVDTIDNIGDVDNLTESIIYLAKKMGLDIVAEGVETSQQLEYLKRYQCPKIQGYLLSKPLPEEDVFKLI